MMHKRNLIALACAAALAGAAQAAAGVVQVHFVEPAKYSDAGRTERDRDEVARALEAHLKALGQQHLAAGQSLEVRITDIDLAGELRPARLAAGEIRVVRGGADWPRISLHYSLRAPGQPELKGSEMVADMGYSQGIGGYGASEPLRHEKQMLSAWFKTRFGAGAQ